MFEVGWTEMLVIAVVMIVVVGPKDLPKMLRTIGKMTAKVRGMAGDFQRQFNEALKEAELDDVKKSVDSLRSMNPVSDIKKQLNPFEKAAADVRAGLQSAMGSKPAAPAEPASPQVHEAEPLKNGATAMPDIAGPTAMPQPPSELAQPVSGPVTTAAASSSATASAKANGTKKSVAAAKAEKPAPAQRKAPAGRVATTSSAAKASSPAKSASTKAAPVASATASSASAARTAKAATLPKVPLKAPASAKKPARKPT